MTTQDIANRLYALCKEGKFDVAHSELYSVDATSTEINREGALETISGLDAIKEKTKQFQSMITEMHSAYTNEPKVFGNNIFMEMGLDVTMKEMGRMNMVEICHYEVKDGKIISERFYY
jgi:hypothetical protein